MNFKNWNNVKRKFDDLKQIVIINGFIKLVKAKQNYLFGKVRNEKKIPKL